MGLILLSGAFVLVLIKLDWEEEKRKSEDRRKIERLRRITREIFKEAGR